MVRTVREQTTSLCFLRRQIQEMRCENETLPDIERLKEEEFCLNIEERNRQEAMVEQEVMRVMHRCFRVTLM